MREAGSHKAQSSSMWRESTLGHPKKVSPSGDLPNLPQTGLAMDQWLNPGLLNVFLLSPASTRGYPPILKGHSSGDRGHRGDKDRRVSA